MKNNELEQNQQNDTNGQLPNEFRFIADSGHSWLEVPYIVLVQLGIAGKISKYSYLRNDMAYLEEDCDAGIFIKAYLNAVGKPLDYVYFYSMVTEVYQENTPIRSYSHYYRR